jgi:apolipoprotein N-acyltransferase
VETISDAQGRVIASADTDRPGLTAISATVAPGDGATLYTMIGDVFAWACMALAIGLSVAGFRMLTAPVSGRRPVAQI